MPEPPGSPDLHALLLALPDLVLRLDGLGRVSAAKAGLPSLFPHGPHDFLGRHVRDLWAGDAGLHLAAAFARVREGLGAEPVEFEAEALSYEARFLAAEPGALLVVRNVSGRRASEGRLRDALSLAQATLESTADGVLVVDPAGLILTHNQRFAEMWHVPAEVLARGDAAQALEHTLSQLSEPATATGRMRVLDFRPDAQTHDVLELTDGRVVERDSRPQRLDGRAVGRVWSFRDVTERHRIQQQMQHQAYHDVLTGLPNRLLLRDRLTQALGPAHRQGHMVAALFIDLDRFKVINDTLGHAAGDELLQIVAGRLSRIRRAGDTLARLGGDEFMMVAGAVRRAEDAVRVAEHVLAALSPPVRIEDHDLHVGASVGISLFPVDGNDAETLIKNADVALYRAKHAGRNTYQIYSPEMNARALERLVMENRLRGALVRRELVLHYQPQLDAGGQLVGAEALVRWRDEGGRLIPPGEFIPAAEDTGLIVSLGHWVLGSACAQAADWQKRGLPGLRLAVNVSARQFLGGTFLESVRGALQQSGLPAASLELEVTESMMLKEPQQAVSCLRALRDMGVRVAVDDFGTGYSSLSYLKRLPLTALKIDQSFVRDCLANADDAAIVEAVISMAHALRLTVVAEGVETVGQLQFLRERGCDEMQGFVLSRPLPAAGFEEWAQVWNRRTGGLGANA